MIDFIIQIPHIKNEKFPFNSSQTKQMYFLTNKRLKVRLISKGEYHSRLKHTCNVLLRVQNRFWPWPGVKIFWAILSFSDIFLIDIVYLAEVHSYVLDEHARLLGTSE